jgi:hypothetical protein
MSEPFMPDGNPAKDEYEKPKRTILPSFKRVYNDEEKQC